MKGRASTVPTRSKLGDLNEWSNVRRSRSPVQVPQARAAGAYAWQLSPAPMLPRAIIPSSLSTDSESCHESCVNDPSIPSHHPWAEQVARYSHLLCTTIENILPPRLAWQFSDCAPALSGAALIWRARQRSPASAAPDPGLPKRAGAGRWLASRSCTPWEQLDAPTPCRSCPYWLRHMRDRRVNGGSGIHGARVCEC